MTRGNPFVSWTSAILILGSLAAAQTYNITDLGGLAGSNNSEGQGVSKCGHVVGSGLVYGRHGFFWSEHGGMRDLELLHGGFNSEAMGINASGEVAGYSDMNGGAPIHGVLWIQGKIHDLGALPDGYLSQATGINDSGEIVGFSDSSGNEPHAVFWHNHGRLQDLGVLPGGHYSQALAVNQHNQVVGFSDNGGDDGWRAFSWTASAGMQDLGTLRDGRAASTTQARSPVLPTTQR